MNEQNHSGSGDNINAARDIFIDSIPRIASDLTAVVNVLSKKLFDNIVTEQKGLTSPFKIETKIQHNDIVRFKVIIDNYKFFVGKLYTIYKEFDNMGTNKTHIVLENIKLTYLKEKSTLLHKNQGLEEIDVIRNSADDLVEAVEASLLNEIRRSSNIESSVEFINLSLQVVLIDAFIRCKILEEPPKDVIT